MTFWNKSNLKLRQLQQNLHDHLCSNILETPAVVTRPSPVSICSLVSRRDFLMRVGQAGGYGAAFATMQSMGLMSMKGEQVTPIEAAAGSGNGVKVVVLGGGIGGLVSAYELKKLGYEVMVLEWPLLTDCRPRAACLQTISINRW